MPIEGIFEKVILEQKHINKITLIIKIMHCFNLAIEFKTYTFVH